MTKDYQEQRTYDTPFLMNEIKDNAPCNYQLLPFKTGSLPFISCGLEEVGIHI